MSQSYHEEPVIESEKKPQVDRQDDAESIHSVNTISREPTNLTHNRSHVSHTHDAPMEHYSSYIEIPDEVCMLYFLWPFQDFHRRCLNSPEDFLLSNCWLYRCLDDRLPHSRKVIIVALLSFCSFLAPISSTTILAAIPEVAATYSSNGTIINLSNALYMLFMGVSPCFWGPLTQVWVLNALEAIAYWYLIVTEEESSV